MALRLLLGLFFVALAVAQDEPCGPSDLSFRRYDGVCNNLLHPLQASSNTSFRRLLPPFSPPYVYPTERCMSGLSEQGHPMPTSPGHNEFFTFFFQFLVHDLEEIESGGNFLLFRECDADPADPAKGPRAPTFAGPLSLDPLTGLPLSQVAARLDLHTVYGFTQARNSALRNATTYEMLTFNYTAGINEIFDMQSSPCSRSVANLSVSLPFWLPPVSITGVAAIDFGGLDFLAPPDRKVTTGDDRAKQSMGLTAHHVAFLRLDRVNREYADRTYPARSARERGELARELTIAMYRTLLEEFVEAAVGSRRAREFFAALPSFYLPEVDPTVSLEFDLMRPHTLVNTLRRVAEADGSDFYPVPPFPAIVDSGLPFAGALSHYGMPVNFFFAGGDLPVLFGMLETETARFDLQITDSLRSLDGGCGNTDPIFDIRTIDFNRTLSVQLASYAQIRQRVRPRSPVYGGRGCPSFLSSSPECDPISCWERVTANVTAQSLLSATFCKVLYVPGTMLDVEDVPLPEEGERFPPALGETAIGVLLEQLGRTLVSDRFDCRLEGGTCLLGEEEREMARRFSWADLIRIAYGVELDHPVFFTRSSGVA